LGPWNAMLTRPGRSSLALPRPGHSIVPADGRSSAAIRCSSEVLPLPEGPARATRSPARISKLASATATTEAWPLPNCRVRPFARTRTSVIAQPPVGYLDDPVRGRGDALAVGHDQHGLPAASPLAQQFQDHVL